MFVCSVSEPPTFLPAALHPPTAFPRREEFSSSQLVSYPAPFFSLTSSETNRVSTGGEKNLYGDGYDVNGCGKLSSQCEKYYFEESCFYECDKNMGKWRKHRDCSDAAPGDNGWQIANMPIKATYCDAWYNACKNDMICASASSQSYFSMPDCLAKNKLNGNKAGCNKFSDVYKDGKEVCEKMWDGSFKYETDETRAYVMTFAEGQPNPNNLVFTEKDYPPICDGHEVNVTHPHTDPITGGKVSALEAGCAADWYMHPDSGHPLNGTKPKPYLGVGSGASSVSLAFAGLASIAMLLLA